MLDTRIALRTARLFMPAGVSDAEAAADLQTRVAAEWDELDTAARRWSQLGTDLPPTRGRVVGRIGWIRANLVTMGPISEMLAEKLARTGPGAGRVMSVQVGALFGLLSTKVLGQFVLPLAGDGSGHLVMVGPNVLGLATEFGDVADDLRRSVLVHEIVHRLQFDGSGWLGGHLRDLLSDYVDATELQPDRVRELGSRLPEALREAVRTGSPEPLLAAVLTPPQQELMERAQGLMSLLEGHGNAAMSLASKDVVADPEAVAAAMASRRGDLTTKVLTQVAGMDMKRRQYVDGEAFVRAVIDSDGVDGVNRAFAGPENLPSLDEISDPAAWLQRTA